MFYCEKWPPDLDVLMQRACKSKNYLPKVCLYHPEMPEIDTGKYKLEVIRDRKIRKRWIWLAITMNEYGDMMLHLNEYATLLPRGSISE